MDTKKKDESRLSEINGFFSVIGVSDSRIRSLLMLSVGRVLIKERRSTVGSTVDEHMALMKMTRHIRDWLVVAVADNAKWLSNVDDLGRPKKLLKFSSLEAISLEADRQMERKQRQAGKVNPLVDGEEKFVADAGDGWSIVQLLTPTALDRESQAMQHCIGHGAYDEALTNKSVAFLSLRDPNGNPHVTCEIREGALVQFQGKQNKPPIERYVVRWLPFFNAEKIDCRESEQFITDVNGVIYSVGNLPEILSVDGDAVLDNSSDCHLRLPRRIQVTGSLHIVGNAFLNVPEEIVVGEDLYIHGVALANTPPNMTVGHSLSLSYMKDVVLPSNFRVEGDLSLVGSSITALPDSLFVEGLLNLTGTDVLVLPSDMRCGSIDISGTKISTFDTTLFRTEPHGSRIHRNLFAMNSALETITGIPHFSDLTVSSQKFETPEGLVVEGTLRIIHGKAIIGKLTKSLGSLIISNSEVDIELENVTIGVIVQRSTVGFGKTLRCSGVVEIRNDSIIKSVPDRIECSSILIAESTLPSYPAEIIASDSVKIFGMDRLRLDAAIKTRDLWISQNTTYLGEKIEAETLMVSDFLPLWKMDYASVKAYIADGGDLRNQPEGATSLHGSLGRNGQRALLIEDPHDYVAEG